MSRCSSLTFSLYVSRVMLASLASDSCRAELTRNSLSSADIALFSYKGVSERYRVFESRTHL